MTSRRPYHPRDVDLKCSRSVAGETNGTPQNAAIRVANLGNSIYHPMPDPSFPLKQNPNGLPISNGWWVRPLSAPGRSQSALVVFAHAGQVSIGVRNQPQSGASNGPGFIARSRVTTRRAVSQQTHEQPLPDRGAGSRINAQAELARFSRARVRAWEIRSDARLGVSSENSIVSTHLTLS